MRQTNRYTRRDMLKAGGLAGMAAVAMPAIIPATARGAAAPSNRITVGCIGVGRMGMGDMQSVMHMTDVLAVCDVDANRAANAKATIEKAYAERAPSARYTGCTAYGDFRELLQRDDIDAVLVCTPDHWHALPAIAAAKAGKDVFIQKPMTLTIEEGRVLRDTVRRYGRVLQVGSQQRSDSRFRFACELVRNGRIGDLKRVLVGVGKDPAGGNYPPTPVPDALDYDMWLGPAPYTPYIEARVHPQRGYGRPGHLRVLDFSLGMVTGWGAHHMDIAHWGMGMEHTGPVEISARCTYPDDGVWTVHTEFSIDYVYPNGVTVNFSDNAKNPQGVRFEGTEGWVHVRRGAIDAGPKSLLKSVIGPEEVHLYRSNDHKRNWLDCIRTRTDPIAAVEIGHRSNSACILGHIAMALGRPIRWNPDSETFPGDDEANRLLSRPMRSPWHV